MYNGAVQFYVMDPNDPVLAVYRRAFPGVFMDLNQLSADLKLHLRYPEDLFSIQADQYRTFHMTVPQVFYNREDLWVLPQENYAGKVAPMKPYYILMKLPGGDQLEYLIMTPFTPQKRNNMISWLAVRLPRKGFSSPFGRTATGCECPGYAAESFWAETPVAQQVGVDREFLGKARGPGRPGPPCS
jgi:hypothetical protein